VRQRQRLVHPRRAVRPPSSGERSSPPSSTSAASTTLRRSPRSAPATCNVVPGLSSRIDKTEATGTRTPINPARQKPAKTTSYYKNSLLKRKCIWPFTSKNAQTLFIRCFPGQKQDAAVRQPVPPQRPERGGASRRGPQ